MGRSPGKEDYDVYLRNRVISAREFGISAQDIAATEGISKRAVYHMVATYNDDNNGLNRPRSGRPPLFSHRKKRIIMREIDRNPFVTNRKLLDRLNLTCSAKTLTAYLQSQGILHKRALMRPKITSRRAAARLEFAQKHGDRSIEHWKRWIFSDETTIERGSRGRRPRVWARRVSEYTINVVHQ